MSPEHDAITERLASIVGAPNLSQAPRDLATLGVHVTAGAPPASTWVVRPGAAAEIAEVMRLAATYKVAVMPVGTASRRAPGARGASRPRIIVDLRRMVHVLHLDETSLVVHAQAGVTGLRLEELLLPRGLTLGDFTPAALRSTLGGLLAVRTPGKSSPRHGFFEDAVLGLSAVLADGRTVHTRVAPRRATGPDLARLLLGSEGALGILTAVVLRVYRRAETRLLDSHRLPSIEAALATMRDALRADARVAANRVYDADEAAAHLGGEHVRGGEALLVLATAGPPELATVERDLIAEIVRTNGGTPLGPAPAEIWWRRRTGHGVPGPVPPPAALQVTAPPSRLAAVYRAALQAAVASGRTARAHFSRFDVDGACIFFSLFDGARPDPAGPARLAVEHAVHLAGGSLPGERDDSLAPYLALLRRDLDPDGILGAGSIFPP